ncbi:MAG: substrate-binding domain-containing protein, partial [bacterium]|nr:substrate-binding domain-containing protein [bacterium]
MTDLGDMGADGVIAFAVNKAQAKTFLSTGLPSVIIPVEEVIPGSCSVVEERYAVGSMAAEHLLNRGFKRFAYCGLNQTYWSRIREEGFAYRLDQAGFEPDVYRRQPLSSQTTWGAEQRQMAAWLRSLPKPVGLMAFNDERAQQVLEAGKLADVRVPDE